MTLYPAVTAPHVERDIERLLPKSRFGVKEGPARVLVSHGNPFSHEELLQTIPRRYEGDGGVEGKSAEAQCRKVAGQ